MAVSSTHKKRELDQTSIPQSCANTSENHSSNTSENDSPHAALTPEDMLFYPFRGSFLIEVDTVTAQALRDLPHMYHIGTTQEDPSIVMGDTTISLDDLTNSYESTLASIFPIYAKEKNFGDTSTSADSKLLHTTQSKPCSKYTSLSHPKVLIPVFPGTNCEYESARAFTEHGAKIETLVIRN